MASESTISQLDTLWFVPDEQAIEKERQAKLIELSKNSRKKTRLRQSSSHKTRLAKTSLLKLQNHMCLKTFRVHLSLVQD